MSATQTQTRTIPLALRNEAAYLLQAAQEHGTRWGERKVYLGTIPGLDLADAECRATLTDLRRSGALCFARADLVAAMDADLVAASEWHDGVATYHFLVLE